MTGTRLVALLTAPLVLLIAAVGCPSPNRSAVTNPSASTHSGAPAVPPATSMLAEANEKPPQAPDAGPDFVGDIVCAQCHASAFRQHRRSRHAAAVRPVNVQTFAAEFQSAQQPFHDDLFNVNYQQYVRSGDCITVTQGAEGRIVTTARYGMGDGRVGTTFLGQDAEGNWYEMRMTYFTRLHRWDYTPNLQPGGSPRTAAKGLPLSKTQLSICLSCHMTTMQMKQDGLLAAAAHLGIGCERCHGPGRQHIAAVKAMIGGAGHTPDDQEDIKVEDLKAASRDRVVETCNVCHSAPSDIPRTPEYAVNFAQFAGTALQQSQCYLRSGTLSCLACHDAHSLGVTRQGGYEAVCLSCHSGTKPQTQSPNMATVGAATNGGQDSVCRVSPHGGCIRCHMPVQTIPSFSRVGFHNHWIGIYKGARPAQ